MIQGLSVKQQTMVVTTGLATVILTGLAACIAVVCMAFWLLVQVVSLCLQATLETLSSVGATYQAADPLVRFLLLVAIGSSVYWLVRKLQGLRGK